MVVDTRREIVQAFLRLAEKSPQKTSFTMKEIAEEAGITRQAIYFKHFRNTEEIVSYIHNYFDDRIREAFYNYVNQSIQNPYHYVAKCILPLIYDGRDWARILYTTQVDKTWKSFLSEIYTRWGMEQLEINKAISKFSTEESVRLIVNMTMDIIEIWISQENPIPPEEFEDIFLHFVNTPLIGYVLPKDNQ